MSKIVENSLLPIAPMQTPLLRCMAGVALITVVASIGILILGTLGVYGPVGSPGFFASTTTGSTIAISYLVVSLIYVIYQLNQGQENTEEIHNDQVPKSNHAYLPFETLHSDEEIMIDPISEDLPIADEATHLAVASKNYPKSEEKETYDKLNKNPLLLPEKTKKFLRNLHFTQPFIEIAPAFNEKKGVCRGACLFVLIDYYKHRNLTATMKKFQGGVPIEGVILQNIYSSLDELHFQLNKSILLHLLEIFEEPCEASNKNLTFSKPESHALEAAAAIMKMLKSQGTKPKEVALANLIEGWIKERYPKESIPDYVHCLIKYVDIKTKNNEWSKTPKLHYKLLRDTIILYLCGLEIEKVLLVNAGPRAFLDSLTSLPTGEYLLSRPYFKFKNGLIGYHAIAFIITADEEIYFYEPNEGFYISKNVQELYTTVAVNFKTTMDFSVSPNGIVELIQNFFLGMHPRLGCFLYKVKEVKTQ